MRARPNPYHVLWLTVLLSIVSVSLVFVFVPSPSSRQAPTKAIDKGLNKIDLTDKCSVYFVKHQGRTYAIVNSVNGVSITVH